MIATDVIGFDNRRRRRFCEKCIRELDELDLYERRDPRAVGFEVQS